MGGGSMLAIVAQLDWKVFLQQATSLGSSAISVHVRDHTVAWKISWYMKCVNAIIYKTGSTSILIDASPVKNKEGEMVDLLCRSSWRGQGIQTYPRVVRAFGRHWEFWELLCRYKVRHAGLTHARPLTTSHVFFTSDICKTLIHPSNPPWMSCCQAIEYRELEWVSWCGP